MHDTIPILDGHNDTLTRVFPPADDSLTRSIVKRDTQGHVDLPRAAEGGLAGGFFAIFIPSETKSEVRPITANDGTTIDALFGWISESEAVCTLTDSPHRSHRWAR